MRAVKRFAKIYLALLGLAALFIGVFVSTYVLVHHDRVLPAADHLVVYGRDSCAYTTRLRRTLDADGIPFEYANIDAYFVELEMWVKLGALTGTVTSARLPVVEFDGVIRQRPDETVLVSEYRHLRAETDST